MMLVVLVGLPGSGKSYFAQEIIRRYPQYVLFNKDVVRDVLFPGELTDFTSKQNDLCMDIIMAAAEYLLSIDKNRVILIDGRTFTTTEQVDMIVEASKKIGTPIKFIRFVCSDETAASRIISAQNSHLAKDRDMDLYFNLKKKYEPLKVPHLLLETDDPDLLEERVGKAISYIETDYKR